MQARDSKGRFCKCDPKLDEYSYVTGFKAFNSDLTCRDKQYKEGETFTENKAVLCEQGMHYCMGPFDVFNYYRLFDQKAGIIKVANVTGKVKYRDVIDDLESAFRGNKVVTTELRIDKVWNVLDYLRLYAPKGIQYSNISYHNSDSDRLILDWECTSGSIVVDDKDTFILHNAIKQLITRANKNYLHMDNGYIYCAKKQAFLEFTGDTCEFAGIDGVHYRLRDTKGEILFEGHIGNAGDLLPNTMYIFSAKSKKLLIAEGIGDTHL